jgi:hypothetical protein
MSISKVGGAGGPPPTEADAPTKAGSTPRARFIEVLGELRHTRTGAQAPPATRPPPGGPGASPAPAAAAWHHLAERALEADRQIEAIIEAARRGKTFSAAELLSLQLHVFRYAQTVEIISRATDKLIGAIKQTLGTQV